MNFVKPNERGVALISSLLALMLLTLLALALTGSSMMTMLIMNNDRQATEAFYLAESGIEHAKGLILTQTPSDLDDLLTSGDTEACNGDELSAAIAPFDATHSITSIAAGGHLVPPTGRYEVVVCDDHAFEADPANAATDPDLPNDDADHDVNGRIVVQSTGFGADGSTATIELVIATVPLPGLLVNGNLRIVGNPRITGDGGAVHANGRINFNGTACAAQHFSASGTIIDPGNARTGTCPLGSDATPDVRAGEETLTVPDLSPMRYRSQADYILGSDGSVRDQVGTVLNPTSIGFWNDWNWQGAVSNIWVAGSGIPQGTYFAGEPSGAATPLVSIRINGNPGAATALYPTGMPLSLIATGFIEIPGANVPFGPYGPGHPRMTPDLTIGGVPVSMMAGTDLFIHGHANHAVTGLPSPFTGLHYARHQLAVHSTNSFGGQIVAFSGQLVALNEADTPTNGIQLVPRSVDGYMEVRDYSIHYGGAGGVTTNQVTGWRECRGSNPATPCQ